MKVVLDIETLMTSREHWDALVGLGKEDGSHDLASSPADLLIIQNMKHNVKGR